MFSTGLQECAEIAGSDASFLRLLPGIDLNEHVGAAAKFLDSGGECAAEFWAVEGLYDIKERDCIFGFVGLQRADQVQDQAVTPVSPVRLCFLDAVFTEHRVICGENGVERGIVLSLGNGDKGCGRTSSGFRGSFDLGLHTGIIGGDVGSGEHGAE